MATLSPLRRRSIEVSKPRNASFGPRKIRANAEECGTWHFCCLCPRAQFGTHLTSIELKGLR